MMHFFERWEVRNCPRPGFGPEGAFAWLDGTALAVTLGHKKPPEGGF